MNQHYIMRDVKDWRLVPDPEAKPRQSIIARVLAFLNQRFEV